MTDNEIRTEQLVRRSMQEVFAFFSDAGNLEAITPAFLKFRILSPRPIQMRVGATIDYRLKLHGIPVKWRSVISAWEPPAGEPGWRAARFVDEQVKGPYRYWHHEHTFEECAAGVMVRDHVRYGVSGPRFVERWFVRPRLEGIFAYRRAAIAGLLEGQGVREGMTARAK